MPDIGNLEILGGANIGTTLIDGKMYVSYTGPTEVADDTTPTLGGNLDADTNNISNVATLTADSVISDVTGDVTGLVHGIDIRTINVASLDLGTVAINITNGLDFFIANNDVDYGSISAASTLNSDFGTFA